MIDANDLEVRVTIPVRYDLTDYIQGLINEGVIDYDAYEDGLTSRDELVEAIKDEALSHVQSLDVPWAHELEHTCDIREERPEVVVKPFQILPRKVSIRTYRFACLTCLVLGVVIGLFL